MSDPDAAEPVPPPQPPRPKLQPTTTGELTQLEADERYARQLAEHYNSAAAYGNASRGGIGGRQGQIRGAPRQNPQPRLNEYDGEERERSFIDGESTWPDLTV